MASGGWLNLVWGPGSSEASTPPDCPLPPENVPVARECSCGPPDGWLLHVDRGGEWKVLLLDAGRRVVGPSCAGTVV